MKISIHSIASKVLAIVALLGGTLAYAQEQRHTHPCGTDIILDRAQAQNPAIFQEYQAQMAEVFARENNMRRARRSTVPERRVIPVVVHIIHNFGPENLSEDAIRYEIEYLNRGFRKLNPDTASVSAGFRNIHANVNIEFRLATIDPNGNCTRGITRTVSPLTNAGNDEVKNLIRWDTRKYLNIWIVNTIDIDANLPPGTFVAGYSYLPGTTPVANEGVVLRAGSISRPTDPNSTLIHEVGHYLNLNHTFGRGRVGEANNCVGSNDFINDTPPTRGVLGSCNRAAGQCPGENPPNTENYMDYANCSHMFTQGQSDRMRASMDSQNWTRFGLWQESNLLATGTSDTQTPQLCRPRLITNFARPRACTNQPVALSVQQVDADPSQPISYTWYAPGARVDTLSGSSVGIVYDTPGFKTISIVARNAAGLDSQVFNNLILVRNDRPVYRVGPRVHSFEASQPFSVNLHGDTAWIAESSSAQENWFQVNGVSHSGTRSLRIRPNQMRVGDVATLTSPLFEGRPDSTGLIFVSAFFRYAAARTTTQTADVNDRLSLLASADCGNTFVSLGAVPSTSLYTGTSTNTLFRPTPAQWNSFGRQVPIDFLRGNPISFRIEVEGRGGNAIYIDNFVFNTTNINDVAAGFTEPGTSLNVYPNPANENTNIRYTLGADLPVSIQVMDMLGRNIYTEELGTQAAGLYEINLLEKAGRIAKGIYVVRVKIGRQLLMEKVSY